MSMSLSLTNFDNPFERAEEILSGLEKFAGKPLSPTADKEATKYFSHLSNLITTSMSQLKDDVTLHPQHAQTWKRIYLNIKKMDIYFEVLDRVKQAIGNIVQGKIPLEPATVSSVQISSRVLTQELNHCFEDLKAGKDIDANLKYATRLLMSHYRFLRGWNQTGEKNLDKSEVKEFQAILNNCKTGMKFLATHIPYVKRHPSFRKLDNLIFHRLTQKNWHDRFNNQIVVNIFSFLPGDHDSYDIICDFKAQNVEDGYTALASWINFNKVCLPKYFTKLEDLNPIQHRFCHLNFRNFEEMNEYEALDFIENCSQLKSLTIWLWDDSGLIPDNRVVKLPENVRQLTHLNCKGNFIFPKEMNSLIQLFYDGTPKAMPHMASLRKLVLRDSNTTELPEGMKSLEYLACHNGLTSLPSDLVSLKYLDVSDCIRLRRLPGNLTNLTVLACDDSVIEELPEGMKFLKYLSLKDAIHFNHLPKGMTALNYLNFKGCTVASLPDDLTSLVPNGLRLGTVIQSCEKYNKFIIARNLKFPKSKHFDLNGNKIVQIKGV